MDLPSLQNRVALAKSIPIEQALKQHSRTAKIPWVPRNPYKPQWDEFHFQHPNRGQRPSQLRNPTFEGWDSETIQDPRHEGLRGLAFVICNSQQALHLAPDKKEANMPNILDFFMQGAGKMNAWYNIDYDMRTIFKWDRDLLLELYPDGNAVGEASYEQYDLVYFRRKFLSITDTMARHKALFYDASLFYQQSLASAALRYLKREPPGMKAHRAEDLYSHYLGTIQGAKEVTDYCKWDATATRDLMQLFILKLHKLDFYPRKPISSGYLAQDYLRSKADLPYVYDAPGSVNRPAWESFMGGWIDIWQRGTMDIWKYDINSAYPWAMADLPDIRDGTWTEEYVKEAPLGFVLCIISQNEDSPIPAIASWMKAVHGYPTFDVAMKKWLTIQEYHGLQRIPGMQIQALRFLCFIPKPDARKPFDIPVKNMVHFKNTSHPKRGSEPDEAVYLASKMIFNSFYGKSCERVWTGEPVIEANGKAVRGGWRAGKLFMPIYASTITAKCRMLMLDALLQHPRDVATIATDCVGSTRPLRLPEHETELGKWKVECEGENAIIVFPGIYQIGNDITHSRGFRIKTCACGHESTQHAVACLYCQCGKFKASLSALIDNSTNDTLEIRYERPWGVREAFRQSDMDMVGVFETKIYDKGLDSIRRLWLEAPATFKDLRKHCYKSIPLPVSFITTEKQMAMVNDE